MTVPQIGPDEDKGRGRGDPIDPAACVWQRPLPDRAPLARRGRGIIVAAPDEPDLLFRDEPDAGEGGEERETAAPSLERDLVASSGFRELVRSSAFAELLYASLCGTRWRHQTTGTVWSASMRQAGAIVASVRGEGDYLDWYCSGGEDVVDERIATLIGELGWKLGPDEG